VTINPLVAARLEGAKDPRSGIWIAEDIELISQGIKESSWVDTTLGVVGASLDGLALISDPLGALLQYGVAWIIEHVKPLTEALDWLAGDPAQIAANAQTWRNVAKSLQDQATDLAANVRNDVSEWTGAASNAYRGWSPEQQNATASLGKAAETMAAVTECAGFLISAVRMLVRDAIATLVSRLIVYAAEEAATLGIATPLVAEQVTTMIASWAGKIARWLKALLTSLRNLAPIIRRLGELIEELKKILGRLRGEGHEPGTPKEPRPPRDSDWPDFDDPDIDPTKITGYEMNPDHPVGGNKYRVIHSVTGLDTGDAAKIEQQIRDGVRDGTPIKGKGDQYGQRWSVDVPLTGPKGSIIVRTAWILDVGSSVPRLITISFP
jgi:uncharacterized protein YukE